MRYSKTKKRTLQYLFVVVVMVAKNLQKNLIKLIEQYSKPCRTYNTNDKEIDATPINRPNTKSMRTMWWVRINPRRGRNKTIACCKVIDL